MLPSQLELLDLSPPWMLSARLPGELEAEGIWSASIPWADPSGVTGAGASLSSGPQPPGISGIMWK